MIRWTSGWDLLASLGHPCKFQWLSHLCIVTACLSSSGHQPNFAALDRGRHLYSAEWSSRWALAHISSSFFFFLAWSQRLWIGCLPYFVTWCGPSVNLECRSETCCASLAGNAGPKNRHLGTISQLCRAISSQLRHVSTIGKKTC